jgi:hypothetical protein
VGEPSSLRPDADTDAEQHRLTRQQTSDFLKASEAITFSGQSRAEVYGWIERVLVAQE